MISQHEARMQTLSESMKEADARKRALEEDVDALREECAKLKAAEQVQVVSNKEIAEEQEAATKMRVALEEQMDQLRGAHQKQVAALRDEISDKQQLIGELKDLNQKFTLAHQQMQSDYERLKQEEADKSVKLQELFLMNERREQVIIDRFIFKSTIFNHRLIHRRGKTSRVSRRRSQKSCRLFTTCENYSYKIYRRE